MLECRDVGVCEMLECMRCWNVLNVEVYEMLECVRC